MLAKTTSTKTQAKGTIAERMLLGYSCKFNERFEGIERDTQALYPKFGVGRLHTCLNPGATQYDLAMWKRERLQACLTDVPWLRDVSGFRREVTVSWLNGVLNRRHDCMTRAG